MVKYCMECSAMLDEEELSRRIVRSELMKSIGSLRPLPGLVQPAARGRSGVSTNPSPASVERSPRSRWNRIRISATVMVMFSIPFAFGFRRWVHGDLHLYSEELQTSVVLPLAQPLPVIALKHSDHDEMAYIPGGVFSVGYGSAGKENSAGPPHQASVAPFYMDKTEVTRASYRRFMETTHRASPYDWLDREQAGAAEDWPVTGVTWEDAHAYCAWTGSRLPTEEEWEFAARGTDGRLYPWGGDRFDAEKANAARKGGKLRSAHDFPEGASPYGILNLSGNVWEWTESDFKPYPGSRFRPEACTRCKALRGGSYANQPEYAVATYRYPYEAELAGPANAYYGFRCARSAGPSR